MSLGNSDFDNRLNSEFNFWTTKSIGIKFLCPHCRKKVEDELVIPTPEGEGNNYSDSLETDPQEIICDHCKKAVTIVVSSSYFGGEIFSDDLDMDDDEVELIIEEYEDSGSEYLNSAVRDNKNYFVTFQNQLDNLKRILNIEFSNPCLHKIQLRMIYVNIITIMETYFLDALSINVFNYQEYKERFIKIYDGIKDKKITLSQFIEYDIDKEVGNAINEIVYHNISTVKGLFTHIFKIIFPESTIVYKMVSTRHDLVHRNGRNKNGEYLELSRDQVLFSINEVEKFVTEINQNLSAVLPGDF